MKKMIERIRLAKSWQERVEIAHDKLPGTYYDGLFRHAADAKECAKLGYQGNYNLHLEVLGTWLMKSIMNDKTNTLYGVAKALNVWKRHKPKPNYEAIVLFSMAGMFPPGWRKLRRVQKDGTISRGIIAAPVAMRDLQKNLASVKPDFTEKNWPASRRKFQRYAKQFSIPLDDTPGRPTK